MSRDNITNEYVSASISTLRADYLAYLDFSGSAPVRLWTGLENKTFTDFSGSAEYIAVGNLGTISAVNETTEVSAKGLEMTLSGIPTDYIRLALGNNYRGRTVVVYLVLSDANRINYQQTMLFRGRMDQLLIEEGDVSSTITVKCESRLIELNRARETRYTDEYQKSLYPDDTGLEFVSGMADKYLYWGTNAPTTTVENPGGGGGGDGTIITPP